MRRTTEFPEAIEIGNAHEAILHADGLANCSSVGRDHLPGSAFPHDAVGGQTWAFDSKYMPVETEFLDDCRGKNLDTLSGFDFFRHMVLDSFEVFTGVGPDRNQIMPRLEALQPA